MTEQKIHILLIEDEAYQRLYIHQILGMYDFEVTTADSGESGWEILEKQGGQFNMILLDLQLPQMSGLDFLAMVKQDIRFANIPVIITSAHNEMDKYYASMDLKAADFLVKPLKPAPLRQAITSLCSRQRQTPLDSNSRAYQKIRRLGRGAYATVDLVKKTETEQLFAMKIIDIQSLNEKQKGNAQREASFMKVLIAPTIIQFVDQFSEENVLYIIMQYANQGTLSDKIKDMTNNGQNFSDQQLLQWTGQLLISLMMMHKRNILHRDLKTQNIFLNDRNVIKVGDMGIAKVLANSIDNGFSIAGTPFYMAPEVVKGGGYGAKADIWSLGCVLYELVMLKKPFEGSNLNSLVEMIINRDYDPISRQVDPRLKQLISRMLKRNPDQRPTAWDLAKLDYLKDIIEKFAQQQGCQQLVMSLFQQDPKKRKTSNSKKKVQKINLIDVCKLARVSIPLYDKKAGWFGKVLKQVFDGDRLVQFFQQEYQMNAETALNNCQDMLDRQLIYHAGGQNRIFQNTSQYQFREDREDIARNMICIWTKGVRQASVVCRQLVNLTNEMISDFLGNLEGVAKTPLYTQFQIAIGELERIDMKSLNRVERIQLYLNIYQIMFIHQQIELPNAKAGWWSDPTASFFYTICRQNFTLKELKHGVLRGNKKPPDQYTRLFSSNDPRNVLVGFNDPRVLLVCPDSGSTPRLVIDFIERYEEIIQEAVTEFCNKEICLNLAIEELILPKVFQTYAADFGGNEASIIRWAWRYYNLSCVGVEDILKRIQQKNLYLNYRDWD